MTESHHVLDIRKKTAQERLRGDHIDLLCQLDEAIKRNDQYEKEMDRLRELLRSQQKQIPPAQPEEEEDSGEVIAGHLATIATLQTTVSGLTNDIKTMTTKEVLMQQSHKIQAEVAFSLFTIHSLCSGPFLYCILRGAIYSRVMSICARLSPCLAISSNNS